MTAAATACDDPRYGRVDRGSLEWPASETPESWTLGRHPRTDRARDGHPGRRRAPAQADRPDLQDPLTLVVGSRHPGSRCLLARLRPALRPRAHLSVRQAHPRLDDAGAAHARAGRPLDLAHRRRLHRAAARPPTRRRPAPAVGTSHLTGSAHAGPRAPGISSASCIARHSGQPAEILETRSGPPEENTSAAPYALPGGQEDSSTGLITS